jgi:RNA polymerase sigma-70 factor (ECF subfamily)
MLRTELIRRAKKGDHEAFAALVVPEVGRLHGLAGLILRDPGHAQDAVQDALLRAWRDLPTLRDDDKFDAWIRRLVVNSCRDQGRRSKRRIGEISLTADHDVAGTDPYAAMVHRDELAKAFRSLSRDDREVVALRYYLDLSTSDAAASLGIAEGAYRTKLHRAIRSMAAVMTADDRAARTEGRWT